MRAVSVAFSPGRPSRLKNEPGIFPSAYRRSSTSTVSGRKSTSRRLPATAVARTIVSPWRTTTAPDACLAILPLSKEISLPAISAEIRVTASLLIFTAFLFRPSVGGPFLFSRYPNHRSLADLLVRSGCGGERRRPAGTGPRRVSRQSLSSVGDARAEAVAEQLDAGKIARRGSLIAPADHPVGIDHDQCPLGEAA